MIHIVRTFLILRLVPVVLIRKDNPCGMVNKFIFNFSFKNNIVFLFLIESIPLCAARVDSLRSHGHIEEALRLAVSVVRTMKQQQLIAQRKWHESQQNTSSSNSSNSNSKSCQSSCKMIACTSRCNGQCGGCGGSNSNSTTSIHALANTDCWVGHPLDPIGSLFDTLSDSSIIPEDQRPRTPSYLGN